LLIGLDLSAAFDAVDHEILLERLQTEFGVEGVPLTWLRSYLDGRTQYVKMGQHQSTATQLEVGVPQRSVLGPILVAVYASPVADVTAGHGVQCHQYADDTQLHLAMRADNTSAGLSVLSGVRKVGKEEADLRIHRRARYAMTYKRWMSAGRRQDSVTGDHKQ